MDLTVIPANENKPEAEKGKLGKNDKTQKDNR